MSADTATAAPMLAIMQEGINEMNGSVFIEFYERDYEDKQIKEDRARIQVKMPGLNLTYTISAPTKHEIIIKFANEFQPTFDLMQDQHRRFMAEQLNTVIHGM